MRDFKNCRVWEKAHRLTLAVYSATASLPGEGPHGLRSQIRRSCVAVPAKIVEGCGRDNDADFARFLQISAGSATRLEYYLLLARDLGLLDGSEHGTLDAKVNDIKRMLATLTRRLKSG